MSYRLLRVLTANRTLWMDAQPPKYIRPFWDTWTMMDTVDRDCADLMQAFPEAIGPFLVHEADTWVPTNEISTYDDFEHLRLHPENARIAIHYDELPISYGAVWVHFPPDSLWASLTPYDTIRNLRGREAAVAYREHGGQPYHFTVMSYDERGRPEALLRYTENLGFEAIHYEYNSMNKLIRLTAADPPRWHTTWYGYDNNGRVDSVWTAIDTVGSGTLLHGKPNDWGLENYVQQRPVDASITYTYTPTGKVDTMYYPQINVATWYHYTPRKWLDTLVATNGLVDLFRQELSYNNVGHITKQFSRQHGAPPNTQLYAYDAIGQLKTWSLNPLDIFNGTVQVYGYDDVGNRTSTTDFQGDPSMLQGSQSYSIGPDISNPTAGPNQLLKVQNYDATPAATDYTTFAYDPDGSMTVRTQYDPLGTPLFEDRYSYSSWRGLTTGFEREDLLGPPPPAPPLIWTWEYRYNAMGEREQKREMASPSGANSLPGHSWSYYLLNGTKEQFSVWRGAEAGSAGTCTWAQEQVAYLYPAEYLVYAVEYPGIREDIPRLSLTPDGDVEYRITDHLASVWQTLDDNGQTVNQVDYEPFGAVLSSQGVERQGFNSREHDGEDGLSNNGVRKLDEGLGRFVAVDPLWEKFPKYSPYIYAFASPLLLVDPDGKQGRGFDIGHLGPSALPVGGDLVPAGSAGANDSPTEEEVQQQQRERRLQEIRQSTREAAELYAADMIDGPGNPAAALAASALLATRATLARMRRLSSSTSSLSRGGAQYRIYSSSFSAAENHFNQMKLNNVTSGRANSNVIKRGVTQDGRDVVFRRGGGGSQWTIEVITKDSQGNVIGREKFRYFTESL